MDGWTDALASEDAVDGKASVADLDGVAVLVYRSGERLFAVANRCTHQGAPLNRGRIRIAGSEATVTCPAHGSVFRLTDGAVVRAPAASPISAFDIKDEEGRIHLRPRGA
jgi:nitrite reductase/ring-hydroxylating ferredoxin subunit